MERLTKREQEVVELMVAGKTNKEIAKELYISVHTVKSVVEHIYEKVGINSRLLVAVYFTKKKYEKEFEV